MSMRNLMAGYTAYTDAQELTAMRGTHRSALVTTTDPTTDTTATSFLSLASHDSAEPEHVTGAPVLVTLRQVG
jgi:hypothetical protein